MSSRKRVAAVALAILLATSGCIGFLTGSEAKTFEAEWAKTEQSVANNAGYNLNSTEEVTIQREFTVAGQTRTVKVINKISTYQKEMDLGPLGEKKVGVFAVISTPAVELGPKTFNPVADYSNEDLVMLLASQYESISNVQKVSEQNITVLGTESTVTKFSAQASFGGTNVDVYIHVTKVRDGADFVVPIGIYPQKKDGEAQSIVSMMKAVTHPAEVSS